MAKENTMQEESGQDKKAAKKAAKLAKQEEKAAKQKEKRRKQLEKAGVSPEEITKALEHDAEYEEEGGSRLAVFLVTTVIIVIWLAILALLVKMDVGGFGSTVLKPLLKDVPYINKILPDTVSEGEQSTELSTESPYSTLDEAVSRIKELEIELQNAKNATADSQSRNEIGRASCRERV